jgi:hypothetical protein
MLNKEILAELYINQKLSTTDIAKKFNISNSRARKLLIENNIPIRSRADGIRAASHKLGVHMIGKKFIRSDETKKKISIARLNCKSTKGTRITTNGYVEYTTGGNKGRSVHVVCMERHIGRRINKNEQVHHINGVKTDNSIENLQLMTINEHMAHHAKENNSNRTRDNKGRYKC